MIDEKELISRLKQIQRNIVVFKITNRFNHNKAYTAELLIYFIGKLIKMIEYMPKAKGETE